MRTVRRRAETGSIEGSVSGGYSPERPLATVVLAAGAGRRYGGTKQLAEIDGRPMLARALEPLCEIGERRIVVLGAGAERVREAVDEAAWNVVVATDWANGPGASLRAGLRAAPEARLALISLGDLPWLRREAAELVLRAARENPEAEAARAFEGDAPGHPVLIRGAALAEAREAPDAGLRPLLAASRLVRVPCDGLGVARDVDNRS